MITLFGENGGDPARPGKKDPLDPLVWLAARPGEPSWPSSLGTGRPGWHVECAAIATQYLGVTFDVQAGGTDLTFPHHEMSASHARVAFGGPVGPDGPVFARHYAHAGMVRLDGEKMSKSRGNLVFVSKLLAAGTDPMAVRLAILAHHYSGDWDWTDAGLAAAQDRLNRWRAAVAATSPTPGSGSGEPGSGGAGSRGRGSRQLGAGGPAPSAESVLGAVRERLADDLDAPGALAVIDAWADAVLAAATPGSDGALVRYTADALLGISL
jgi:L-cysteine:1D-myo-inositol 2-amino-2-deoxy-alpha-D-glucopyranoside ligase